MSNKYSRAIISTNGKDIIDVDVYSILEAFDVNNSAIQHAVKKLLAPGKRGHKSEVQDVKEAIESLNRALVMLEEIDTIWQQEIDEWIPLKIKIDD